MFLNLCNEAKIFYTARLVGYFRHLVIEVRMCATNAALRNKGFRGVRNIEREVKRSTLRGWSRRNLGSELDNMQVSHLLNPERKCWGPTCGTLRPVPEEHLKV